MSDIASILLEEEDRWTWDGRGVLDEPGVEADAVGGAERDVLVVEVEPRRGDGVGPGEPREDGDVHHLLDRKSVV